MPNPRVLVLVNDLLPGGAQKIAYDIATKSGMNVTVAYFTAHQGAELLRKLMDQGVPTIHLEGKGVLQKLARLRTVLKEKKFDVLQTLLPYSGIIGRSAGALAGVPVISAQCNLPHTYPLHVRILDALTLPLAKAWVGNTSGIEKAYGGSSASYSISYWQSGRRHYTLYAGVDVERIRETVQKANRPILREGLGIPNEAPVLMMTARLISWKGHRTLIRAMAHLPEAHLLLVGWGPLEAELKALAQELSVADRVHFLGQRNDVTELLSIADCYVQTHEEGPEGVWMGPNLSQMEACAAGVPSISSAVPNIEELIEDGVTGRLAQLNDAEDLARVVTEVLRDPVGREHMAAAARTRVTERFSSQVMAKTYGELYTTVV